MAEELSLIIGTFFIHLLKEPLFVIILFMVVRMKHTKGKRNRVRSHHALSPARLSICGHCRAENLPHTVCRNCGYYAGREVVDVLAKLDKRERKKKEKELHEHEAVEKEKEGPLSAEELSHR